MMLDKSKWILVQPLDRDGALKFTAETLQEEHRKITANTLQQVSEDKVSKVPVNEEFMRHENESLMQNLEGWSAAISVLFQKAMVVNWKAPTENTSWKSAVYYWVYILCPWDIYDEFVLWDSSSQLVRWIIDEKKQEFLSYLSEEKYLPNVSIEEHSAVSNNWDVLPIKVLTDIQLSESRA